MPTYASIKDNLKNNKKDLVVGAIGSAVLLFTGVKAFKWVKKEIEGE